MKRKKQFLALALCLALTTASISPVMAAQISGTEITSQAEEGNADKQEDADKAVQSPVQTPSETEGQESKDASGQASTEAKEPMADEAAEQKAEEIPNQEQDALTRAFTGDKDVLHADNEPAETVPEAQPATASMEAESNLPTVRSAVANGWEKVTSEESPDVSWIHYNNSSMTVAFTWNNGTWTRADKEGNETAAFSGYVNIGQDDSGKATYYLLQDGKALTGWQLVDGKWLKFGEASAEPKITDGIQIDSAALSGFQKINDKKYYLDKEGNPAKSKTLTFNGTSYDFDAQGVCTKEYPEVITGAWKEDYAGKWYQYSNNTFPKDGWEFINNKWYHFNQQGYMETGWLFTGNQWYYLNSTGEMATGWVLVNGIWYYCDEQKGGAMQTGWALLGGKWYYMDASGAMQTGWVNPNGRWYYCNPDGAMLTGWALLGGKWYYMDDAQGGAMTTGWVMVNGTWYYCDESGAMAVNAWSGNYYLQADGSMATNTWIGDYYVGGDGAWVPNYDSSTQATDGTWLQDGRGWYFQYNGGGYAYDAWIISNGGWYYVGSDGYMVTGWKFIGGYNYYFDQNGRMSEDLRSLVTGPYVIKVNRAQCVITVYAYDTDTGNYDIPVKAFICSVGMPWSPTITGTFYTSAKYSYKELNGPTWGKWCTRIVGGYLFHSMPSNSYSPYIVHASKYNALGSPASGGCIRMTVPDAKWIYDNCALGTQVTISDDEYLPYAKPTVPQMSADSTVDPVE